MSRVIQTPECYPEKNVDRLFLGGFIAAPRHEDCPGGFHIKGFLGGWHCPCPCHNEDTECRQD